MFHFNLSRRFTGIRPFLLLILFVSFLLFGILACSSRTGTAAATNYIQYFNLNWAQHKLWDDGLAEVAEYKAERIIYNKVRQFDYTLITVKEDFNQAYNVKTDDYQRQDLFPVIKVNEFARIPTDNYPYHYLTSLFFKRENPVLLHKLTGSSQEWCGNTFKAITHTGSSFTYAFNSYWDNQGTGDLKLNKLALFEDQLPFTLRSLRFAANVTFQAPVYELQQTSKAAPPTLYQATFTISQGSPEEFPQGAWLVTVQLAPGKQSQYWFDKNFPNTLLRQKSSDGRTLELKAIRRYAYWQH